MQLSKVISIIKLAQKNNFFSCLVPTSKFILSFIRLLTLSGLVNGFVFKNNQIEIFLRYDKLGNGILSKIRLCSKPGKKIFKKQNNILKYTHYQIGSIISSSAPKIFINFGGVNKNKKKGGKILGSF